MGGQPAADDPHLVDLPGRDVGAEVTRPAPADQGRGGPDPQLVEVLAHRPPVNEPAPGEPEPLQPSVARMAGQHQSRPRMSGLEHAIETAEDRRQPSGAPAQRGGPLVVLGRRRRSHLPGHVLAQRPSSGAGDEQPQDLV
jgi:hypothetical protein